MVSIGIADLSFPIMPIVGISIKGIAQPTFLMVKKGFRLIIPQPAAVPGISDLTVHGNVQLLPVPGGIARLLNKLEPPFRLVERFFLRVSYSR